MALLDLVVPGDPIAKGRPRVGRNGIVYTPRRTQLEERRIAVLAAEQYGELAPVGVACGIAVEFHCATLRRTDGDNMLKLVTDALNKVIYTDDYLLEEYFCRVQRGVGKDQARSEIYLYELR